MKKAPRTGGAGKEYLKAVTELYSTTPRADVHAIKAAVDPCEFYRYELPKIKTTRAQWVNGGLCPFHDDNKPGSFFVNTDTGAYRCFSCGARGGDIIAFIQQRDGLTFQEAIDLLASEWEVRP